MKFGEAFTEYLHGDQERFLDKCSHVEYKRLKKVLKSCRGCKASIDDTSKPEQENTTLSKSCQYGSCASPHKSRELRSQFAQIGGHVDIPRRKSFAVCDQKFFAELKKEALDVSGFFSSRVRHLLSLHISGGFQRYVMHLRQCFKHDQLDMVQEGQLLIEYVTMNATAIRKILKKYDKVHNSENGKIFKDKMRAEHLELLKSPWLIELGAFYLNSNGIGGGEFREFPGFVSCDLSCSEPVMTLTLPNSIKLEYDLSCAICLETVFNPCALSCGHLFCKLCACSAASVMLFQGLKAASPDSKCPICREIGVYNNAVHLLELDLLLKRGCKDWKERLQIERAEMVKQSKEYWDKQTKYVIGY